MCQILVIWYAMFTIDPLIDTLNYGLAEIILGELSEMRWDVSFSFSVYLSVLPAPVQL